MKGVVEIFERNGRTVFKLNGLILSDQSVDYALYVDMNTKNVDIENWFIVKTGKWRMKLIRWILRWHFF